MELFDKLGAEIESTWREQNYNEELFPAIAADALRRADLPSKLSAWDVIEWTLAQSELPPQKDPTAQFGDPPITVFVSPRFYIDVYFWLDGTTAIHQHGFAGAFQVLLGSSIHSWYEFDRTEAVNSFVETGEMSLKVCELLKVGDVQEIRAGRQYIHSLFHLDQPSATIVVRTEKSPLYLPQFAYYKPSLAVDPFFEHQTTTRKMLAASVLFQVDHPDTDRLVDEMLATSDFHTSFLILSFIHGALRHRPLGQLFKLDASSDRFERFLEIVCRRHGAKADRLDEVFRHRDASNEIVRRRGYVTDPEHRFFFALLLNVEDRETILRLIGSRFPGVDPIEKILDWTHDLAHTRVVGANTPNALGIEGFDDVDLSILEAFLRGKSEGDARTSLESDYGTARLETIDVDGKLSRIRESVIFRPLL
ncbi:MAG TPA: hypothetical protein VJV05_10250 [Pyrinomonadaceae bacterium]|nr:hypothetical protein [Pyrinomonadaceae bacterium]